MVTTLPAYGMGTKSPNNKIITSIITNKQKEAREKRSKTEKERKGEKD
jgi:hypothetical protein